jgi:hypothetical protein
MLYSIAVLSNIRDVGLSTDREIEGSNVVSSGLNQLIDFNRALLMFPEQRDYLYGLTYLAVLVNPIPREFFPNKPVGIGAIMGEVNPVTRVGVSISITFFGEAYANFGGLGIFIISFLFGYISKLHFIWFIKNKNLVKGHIIYFFILPFYVIEVRGGFLEITMRLFIEFVSLMIILKLSIITKKYEN